MMHCKEVELEGVVTSYGIEFYIDGVYICGTSRCNLSQKAISIVFEHENKEA